MRRIADIAVSAAALLLLAPLLAALSVAVCIGSPGGPIYAARRVGRGGRVFKMLKFRTMVAGAAQIGPAITFRGDPRITSLGRVLRRTKLDELPQFVNVLLGDMTLIGPRPEAPEIVAFYDAGQRAILAAKPGITGYSQLHAGHEDDETSGELSAEDHYVRHLMDRKIRQDLEYLSKRTVWSDFRVLAATAGLVWRSVRL